MSKSHSNNDVVLSLPEDLPEDVKQELNDAFDEWKASKTTSKNNKLLDVNRIVDAYVKFSQLMRKYVDASWS